MPDRRMHRGAHPEDAELFAPSQWPALRAAGGELAWLLDRGYAMRSALALTGDRHRLTQRQRLAVARSTCSAEQLRRRTAHRIEPAALGGQELWIDGYNLLISVESALAGGVILLGRDGCYRDMASQHGTYREVTETSAALKLIGETAAAWGATKCNWLLDRPVANSGRLKSVVAAVAANASWNWVVRLEFSPDRLLSETGAVVASSDSVVLDRCERWCNVAQEIIGRHVPQATVIDLSGGDAPLAG